MLAYSANGHWLAADWTSARPGPDPDTFQDHVGLFGLDDGFHLFHRQPLPTPARCWPFRRPSRCWPSPRPSRWRPGTSRGPPTGGRSSRCPRRHRRGLRPDRHPAGGRPVQPHHGLQPARPGGADLGDRRRFGLRDALFLRRRGPADRHPARRLAEVFLGVPTPAGHLPGTLQLLDWRRTGGSGGGCGRR